MRKKRLNMIFNEINDFGSCECAVENDSDCKSRNESEIFSDISDKEFIISVQPLIFN